MRIVLDTNVLVSGLLSAFGPPAEIVRMVSSGELTLCLDARVFSEYADVLARPKFRLDQDNVAALLDYIVHTGQMVAASPLPDRLPDPSDEPFLEVAVGGRAECVVTGNLVHFPEEQRLGVLVVSPTEFLEAYREHGIA
jgi:putative PIN family toxin of toxin-antitoxin system